MTVCVRTGKFYLALTLLRADVLKYATLVKNAIANCEAEKIGRLRGYISFELFISANFALIFCLFLSV